MKVMIDPWRILVFSVILTSVPAAAQHREALIGKLDARFSHSITDPAAYSKRVHAECRMFPEGQLFPYTFLALAWCHRCFEQPELKPGLMPRIESALRLAYQSSKARFAVDDLRTLTSTRQQGCYVSNLAMASAAYRLAGGRDPIIVETGKHLVSLLTAELSQRKGNPIFSYPDSIWPIETSVALFAIELHDRVENTQLAKPLINDHYQWIARHGLDQKFNLPVSQLLRDGQSVLPRGCDLSWRLALWKEMESDVGSRWYRQYHKVFWRKTPMIQGLREWPSNRMKTVDLDSGPIVDGIGATASTLGVCSTQAYRDHSSTDVLFNQANLLANARQSRDLVSKMMVQTMDKELKRSGIPISKEYVTGFLFGDCTAFYAFTWNRYPKRPL